MVYKTHTLRQIYTYQTSNLHSHLSIYINKFQHTTFLPQASHLYHLTLHHLPLLPNPLPLSSKSPTRPRNMISGNRTLGSHGDSDAYSTKRSTILRSRSTIIPSSLPFLHSNITPVATHRYPLSSTRPHHFSQFQKERKPSASISLKPVPTLPFLDAILIRAPRRTLCIHHSQHG